MASPGAGLGAAPGDQPLNLLLDRFGRVLDGAMVLLLALMVLLVFGNVVLRYAFDSGITVSEELSRWLFVWMTFLGAIVAIKERGHLGTDMLVSRLPKAGKKACLIVGHLLMLYVTWLLFQGSLAQTRINWEVEAPVSGASMAIFYGAGVFFAVFAGLLLLRETWRALTGRISDEELVTVQESEDMAQVHDLHLDEPPSGTTKR
jgi:TRAP-type C4-dicarboxylate transport system permease small subunit